MLIYISNVRACIRLDEDSQEETTGDQEVKCQEEGMQKPMMSMMRSGEMRRRGGSRYIEQPRGGFP